MFFVWMGFALFALISSAVGLRLVLMWRRTRQLPELLIGIGVLGIGPVGFGFLTLGMGLAEAGIPGAPLAAAIGSAACLAGASAKFLFNSKVYRPQSRIVDRAVKAILVTSALLYVVHLVAYGFANGREHPVWYVLRGWLQVGCLLWGAAEAFVYYGRMRRRVALQLADGLTANRFMLWGLAAGSAGLGTLFGIVAVMIGGQQIIMHPAILASSSVFGSVSAVAMGLAFFPPRALRAYFEAGERSAA